MQNPLRHRFIVMSLLGYAGVIALFFADHTAIAQNAAPPPPAVVVIEAQKRDVTPRYEYPGRAEAVETVDIRARVEGFLEKRNFTEGGDVEKDQLLFIIEQEPYQIVVDQREAELASARATLSNAQADFKRKKELVEKRDVSQATLDQSRAELESARAAVLGAEAALRAAELDLSYTEIRSPIAGRISRATYSIGNLVSSSSDPLTTVTSYDPIHISIQVSEKQLIASRRRGIDLENPPVAPSLVLSDGSNFPFEGKFDYLAPSVDRGTDTVTARATFDNPDKVLLPGQFVTVVVRQKKVERTLAVPQTSVQQDATGYFVLTVDDDDTVHLTRIEVGRQIGTDWVVTDGLVAGQRVIVQGVQKASPGAKVSPTSQAGS